MDNCNHNNKSMLRIMASRIFRLSECDKLLNNFKEFSSENSSEYASTERSNFSEPIEDRLKNLPKIKARPGFDQKMAAAFALELEKETIQRNKSWLMKHSQISLPEVITDLTKNF